MKLSRLLLAAAACMVAPWAVAQSVAPPSGVLITHVNSQQWQVRLISGSTAQRFSGVLQASTPITGVKAVLLEGTDSAKLLTATSRASFLASSSVAKYLIWRRLPST